ncbi:MAG: CinA family nicotinamide mononucleotide deamidase-related protein [Chromatiales bacterium]|jgi:nicotinamide-nucleotide amidase|nr:CinA family nicotinamide mononucleotide deamidase-related protein [Chromatiales bacterium]
MRCEIVAVGTELLLGQIVDTNSSWIGEQLALAGIDCLYHTRVGDNFGRIEGVLRQALERADAVVVCGGLGPTQDDITRDVIARVMGVEMERRGEIADYIRARFEKRGRVMPENNLRQADVPIGASVMEQFPGTAPGLVCPIGEKVVYAVPGVPHEMRTMTAGTIIPDLRSRAGLPSVIGSRTLRTWGQSESGLAEMLADRIDALDAIGNPTIAFLASGIEGLKVRVTAKGPNDASVRAMLDSEEALLRGILGDLVFALDGDNMEATIVNTLRDRGQTLGVAEPLTGGMLAERMCAIADAGSVLRGAIVPFAADLAVSLLGLPDGTSLGEASAGAMAENVRATLGCDIGIATTGVAGPGDVDGCAAGTVFLAVALPDRTEVRRAQFPGAPLMVRQVSIIGVLNMLRLLLDNKEPRML